MEKLLDNKTKKIFRQLFVETELKMQEAIQAGKKRYPEPDVLQKKIAQVAETQCTWRLIVDIELGMVRSLYDNDPNFPLKQHAGIDELIACIHPSYLKPFLLCAENTYKFLAGLAITPEEALDYTYQIVIPIKFPRSKDYSWYLQISEPICINEHKILLSHANTYFYEKDFNHFEYRLVQPSILKRGKVFHAFQEGLFKLLKSYMTKELTAHEKKALLLYAKQYKLKAVAEAMETTPGTERARSNTIMKKVKLTLGFKFSSIAELADFFHTNDMLG